MKRILFSLIFVFCLATPAYCAELNISDGAEAPVEVVSFETPENIPDGWYPLKQVSEYLPISVFWNAESRAVVIDSEPMALNWSFLAHAEYAVKNFNEKDLMIYDGTTYCSPWFLARTLCGLGFVHDGEVWYCDTSVDLQGCIDAALLELSVVVPDEYEFIMKYLSGGVKIAKSNDMDVVSYVYPYHAVPICYICSPYLYGVELASTIAHEAWHVYEACNGIELNEFGAMAYEKQIENALLREIRIRNGTISFYE